MNYKKGDRVRVWSLQSFSHGGFLNGEPAVVRQDQTGDSVILAVVRNIDGIYKLDKSYEVYAKQCELYIQSQNCSYAQAKRELEEYAAELIS
jgi:hypothetical protein